MRSSCVRLQVALCGPSVLAACTILVSILMTAAPCYYYAVAVQDWDEFDDNSNLATSAMRYTSCSSKRASTLCGPSSFTFYMHNTVYNPSVDNKDSFNSVYGLPPNVTWPNPLAFGVTSTFEDPITAEQANTSEQIGMGQGFAHLDSKVDYTLFHIFTANITKGSYKGTINIFGQTREKDPVRYLSVIGGTGDFLGARGLAVCRRVMFDSTPPAKWTLSFDLDLYY